jgi:hypothetical protein
MNSKERDNVGMERLKKLLTDQRNQLAQKGVSCSLLVVLAQIALGDCSPPHVYH